MRKALAALAAAPLLFGLTPVPSANAAARPPFVVNTTADADDLDFPGGTFDGSSDGRCDTDAGTSGDQCTLRAAIQQANKSRGKDRIHFDIPGTGVKTLTPTTRWPDITRQVTIDGFTQEGSVPNTAPFGTNAVPLIHLQSAVFADICSGLRTTGSSSRVVLRGLVISRFEICGGSSSGSGIRLAGKDHRIEGNFIGTDPTGLTEDRNGRGILLDEATGVTIGGEALAARNLISGNIYAGIELRETRGTVVRNNVIGPDKTGGTLPTSNAILGGVVVDDDTTGNTISGNTIYNNDPALGINLEGGTEDANEVTSNDAGDADTGANRLQNYPVITQAQRFPSFTSISGELSSTPSTADKKRKFVIEFFSNPTADPSGYGEGRTFLGSITVQTNNQGETGIFTFAPSTNLTLGHYVTATATDKSRGDTSEFSAAKVVEEPPIEG